MNKDKNQKELTLKQHYKESVLRHMTDAINACHAYKHFIPDDMQDAFHNVQKSIEIVITKTINSNDESWKT